MQEAYTELAQLGKAIAHPARLQILELLSREEACVCHLTAVLGLRQSNVSQHLTVLRDAGLVRDRREGTLVYYRLADARAAAVLALLRDILRDLHPELVFNPMPLSPVEGCPCPHCEAASCCK